MAFTLIPKQRALPKRITYNNKISFKKRLLCATGFVSAGVIAIFIQGVFIHNNPNMQDSWLMSGQVIPTPNPIIEENNKLKNENRRFRELISRGEVDRRMAEVEKNKIINAINKHISGGLLEGRGNVYYDAGMQNSVSPILMAAISIHETSDEDKNGNWKPGNSKVLRKYNNVGGINWSGAKNELHEGRYRIYKNIDDSIYHLAYLLKNFYIDKGRTDIASIGARYCPLDDPDDGKFGMENSSWVPTVTKLYEKISADAK